LSRVELLQCLGGTPADFDSTVNKSQKNIHMPTKKVSAKLYKGMPHVELTEDDKVNINLQLNDSLSKKIVEEAAKGPISISLESLEVDLQHNQSFGMIRASTGCISNPGGPSC
jgi:hypothetical protein